jgi:hypothetical protein
LASDKGSAEHQHCLDRPRGEIEPARFRQIGEMQAVAAHAHPDRRPQPIDQFELHRRRRGGSGAGPVDGNAADRRGAREHLADRMNAERKRHMRPSAAPAVRAIINSREPDHRSGNIRVAARVE